MYLEQLIERLKKEPKDKTIKNGFGKATHYLEDSSYVCFKHAENVSVGSMLEEAKAALLITYLDSRKRELTVSKYCAVYISETDAENGDDIGKNLLEYILSEK